MDRSKASRCHHRTLTAKEIAVRDANLDAAETTVLEVSRFFFQSFAEPQCHAWMTAFQSALTGFPRSDGLSIALRILAMVQGMRAGRRSCFRFNAPTCPGCAAYLTEHERQFIGVLVASRLGRASEAQTHALVLCEGQQNDRFLTAAQQLSDALGPRQHREASLMPKRSTSQTLSLKH